MTQDEEPRSSEVGVDRTAAGGPARLGAGDRRLPWLALLLALLLTGLGYLNRFLQDDAYISFRYAAHLVEHGELNWNPGEQPPIEGYTNFLWTLLMAGAIALGHDPGAASQAVGLLLGCSTLLLTYLVGRRVLGSPRQALLAMFLLGTHFSFSAYMTGGLETMLQTFLLLASALQVLRLADDGPLAWQRPALLSLLLGLAFLTRMDSALPAAVLYLSAVMALKSRLPGSEARNRALSWLTLPGATLAAAWLAWKLQYYGGVLPNTWYVKGASATLTRFGAGAVYLATYLQAYALLPLLALLAWHGKEAWRSSGLALCLLLVVPWWAYVISVGGDFMEFRFLIPVTPALMLLIAWVWGRLQEVAVRRALLLCCLGASLLHGTTFGGSSGIESVPVLQGHLTASHEQWLQVGKALGETFGEAGDVLIATMPAGAIPYVSKLRTVDMLGLSDHWVARFGDTLGKRPGHTRVATLEYLLRRGVNLLVAHPQVHAPSTDEQPRRPANLWGEISGQALPEHLRAIEVPLADGQVVEVLYLTAHPGIDAVIAARGLRQLPLDGG